MHLSKLILSSLILTTAAARACDLCGCYTPTLQVVHEEPSCIFAGLAEQFTHFSTDRLDGRKVDNPTGEYLDSSTTQLVLGASFLDHRASVQFNLPLIYRSYQRPAGFATDRGHVSGLGDVSLLANYIVFRTENSPEEPARGFAKDSAPTQRGEPDFSATLSLTAGLKIPTGETSRLKENFSESDVEGAPPSGIGGHDLALGTGSYDGVLGAQFLARYRAAFFQADAQFTLRGRGAHQYRYANGLTWSGGPGAYLIRKGADTLAVQCVVSGETNGYNSFQGAPDLDTGVTALYVGPRITASLGRVNGEIGLDLPVLMNTTGYNTTPDYRIRAGFTIHF